MQQKPAILCLQCKSPNINLLFIELLYKIDITFLIMLIFEEKRHSLGGGVYNYWRFSTTWYGTVRHGSLRYGTAQFGLVCVSTAV